MSRRLSAEEVTRQLEDLPTWRFSDGALHVRYDAPDFPAAVRLLDAVAVEAEEMQHHPDVDLRWKRLTFALSTHSEGGVTQLDVELAHRVAAAASSLGATAEVAVPVDVQIAIDAVDAEALIPFWQKGLGYQRSTVAVADLALVDPLGHGPTVWFQAMDPLRTERSRIHVDVYVPASEARERVDAVVAAGGRLVTDEHAPSWWVLADAEGNELCVCTEEEPPGG